MRERIVGFDYLRAVMSVFVVIWHMGGGGGSLFLKYHVLLLAVPTFIIVSNFLFARKNPELKDLSRQVKRILILLSFWPVTFILYSKTGILGPIDLIPHSPGAVIVFLLRGGNTIYYFFVSLLFTSLLVYVLLKLQTRLVFIVFIASCILLCVIPLLDRANSFTSYKLSYHFNPTNFLPYPSAAILVLRLYEKIKNCKKIYWTVITVILLLSILFALFEWKVLSPAGATHVPVYARVSIVLSAIILLILGLNSKIPPHAAISFISLHSLALYCLHPFLIVPVKKIVLKNLTFMPNMISLYVSIIIVILLCYIASILLEFYLKKEIIR